MEPRFSPRARSLGGPALLALLVVLLLIIPGVARAGTQRCEPSADDSWIVEEFAVAQPDAAIVHPATDGKTVVWADDRNGSFDVFAYDVASAEQYPIRTAEGDQVDPVVANWLAVWVDDAGEVPVVTAAALERREPWVVSAAAGGGADTDGNLVVWTDLRNGEAQSDIYAYDAESGESFAICTAEGAQLNPAASDGVVVWQDDRNSTWDVYGYDVAAGEEFLVAGGEGDQMKPDIYCGVVVWEHRPRSLVGAATRCEEQTDIRGCYLPQAAEGVKPIEVGAKSAARSSSRCEPGDENYFVVCNAWGNQTDPSVWGPLVAWADDRSGASDIYGYDLMGEKQLVLCDAEGAQTEPWVGDGLLVWNDYRSAEGGAVWAAHWAPGGKEEDPPITDEWTDESLIRLFFSAIYDLGLFTDVRFSFDGQEWTAWQALDEIEELRLPEGDGAKTIYFQLRDGDGHETPVLMIGVVLDTRGPRTFAPVPTCGTKGGTALVKFKVRDALSPRADVRVLIRDRHGKLVRTVDTGARRTGRLVGARFGCDLDRGRYTFSVRARDLAGNRQVRIGHNTLVVR
jgi:beta propeller repeat protein